LWSNSQIPLCIGINQEGYVYITESDLDNFEISVAVQCTSQYNDAYSGRSDFFKIYINRAGRIPSKSWLNVAIIGSSIGGVLVTIGFLIWWKDYVSKKRKARALAKFNKRYGNTVSSNDEHMQDKPKKEAKDKHIKKSRFTKIKNWITMKDIRSKPKREN
jgi:hypothetical protein